MALPSQLAMSLFRAVESLLRQLVAGLDVHQAVLGLGYCIFGVALFLLEDTNGVGIDDGLTHLGNATTNGG